MQNLKSTLLVFVLLAAAATLFPPYHWGEEKLQTTKERDSYIGAGSNVLLSEVLPIKQYDFLFNPSRKQFQLGWGWDSRQGKSVQIRPALERNLIISELCLEYALAMCAAYILSLALSSVIKR
jgi:hypothetical protein